MAQPELATKIDGLMGGLAVDLARLARLPSDADCASPPRRLVPRAHDLFVELLRTAGVGHIRDLTRPEGNPLMAGSIPPPTPAAPTVLLYADYDMLTRGEAPAPPVLVHLGTLRAFDGRPPVGVEIVFEGQEAPVGHDAEQAGLAQRPEDYDCDAMVYHTRAAAWASAGSADAAAFAGRNDGAGHDACAELTELRGAVLAEVRLLEHYAADFARVSR